MPYKFAVTTVASLIMNYTKYNISDLTSEEIQILKTKLGLSSDENLMGEDVYSVIDNCYVKTKEIPLIETVYAIYDIIEART
jgi:hypothetical protein